MGNTNAHPDPPPVVCILNRAGGTVSYWGENQGPAETKGTQHSVTKV